MDQFQQSNKLLTSLKFCQVREITSNFSSRLRQSVNKPNLTTLFNVWRNIAYVNVCQQLVSSIFRTMFHHSAKYTETEEIIHLEHTDNIQRECFHNRCLRLNFQLKCQINSVHQLVKYAYIQLNYYDTVLKNAKYQNRCNLYLISSPWVDNVHSTPRRE